MKNRTVRLNYPRGGKSPQKEVNTSATNVPAPEGMSIYDTVNVFKNTRSFKSLKFSVRKVRKRVLLRNVINLHNVNGIKNIPKIRAMLKKIRLGGNIFSLGKFPNIKLAREKDKKELVLFDGHHSLLAYMRSGKIYLDEIPHWIIENEKTGFVTDEEILVFFGKKHFAELKRNKDWRDYVINWHCPEKKQIRPRVQKNMGELLDSLKDNLTIK